MDDTGKVRIVEYGATKYGFEPAGEGITVAPPTLVDETTNKDGTLNPEYVDQSYQSPPIRTITLSRPQPVLQPSLSKLESYSPPQQFIPAQRSASPVPARPSVAGASLTTTIDYTPQTRPPSVRGYAPAPQATQFSFAPEPAPIQEDNYAESVPVRPALRPAAPQYSQPAPPAGQLIKNLPVAQLAARPVLTRPVPVSTRQSGGGILDQLAKDYALPSGGAAPLHDISFGYY